VVTVVENLVPSLQADHRACETSLFETTVSNTGPPRIQCVMGWLWGLGPQTDKHLPQSRKVPLQVNFFR